ncbi:hypothetical protein AD936_01185, partial [Gluconobacter japonicus]
LIDRLSAFRRVRVRRPVKGEWMENLIGRELSATEKSVWTIREERHGGTFVRTEMGNGRKNI